jgi:hypothetical protein
MLGKDYHFTKRKNGGEWDVYGMEHSDTDHPMSVGMHNIKYFRHYRINYNGIADESPNALTISQDLALYNVTEGKLENVSKENENFLVENGYVIDVNGALTAAFPLIPQKLFVDNFVEKAIADNKTKYPEIDKYVTEACDILKSYAKFAEKEIKNDAPDFLKDNKAQIGFALTTCLFHARGAILEEALKTGFIKYDPGADHRMLGAFLIKGTPNAKIYVNTIHCGEDLWWDLPRNIVYKAKGLSSRFSNQHRLDEPLIVERVTKHGCGEAFADE